MKKIAVESLREGQSFSAPVYIEGKNLLVPAGIAIRQKDIDRLKGWGIVDVYSDGEAVNTSVGSGAAKKPASAHGEAQLPRGASRILSLPAVQENKSVYRAYMDLIDRLNTVFEQIAGGLSVETRSIDAIASRLLQAVRENRDQVIGFILGGEVSGHELAKSSVNVAILSTLIAIEMKLPNHKILHLM